VVINRHRTNLPHTCEYTYPGEYEQHSHVDRPRLMATHLLRNTGKKWGPRLPVTIIRGSACSNTKKPLTGFVSRCIKLDAKQPTTSTIRHKDDSNTNQVRPQIRNHRGDHVGEKTDKTIYHSCRCGSYKGRHDSKN